MARTFLIASCDHPDTREGRPKTVRLGAVRSFMIAASDQFDIYRARRGGAPDDAGARCRARAPAWRTGQPGDARRRPHTRRARARGTVDELARRANARRPDLRVAPTRRGDAALGRCPTGPGQRRDLGLWRKPFIFFNKLYKASADFFARSCKELEILTAWLKGQVARARWRQSSRADHNAAA